MLIRIRTMELARNRIVSYPFRKGSRGVWCSRENLASRLLYPITSQFVAFAASLRALRLTRR